MKNLQNLQVPRDPAPAAGPSQKRAQSDSKIHQNFRPLKNRLFSENGAILDPQGHPKIRKISNSASQGRTFYPFRKTPRNLMVPGPSRTRRIELPPLRNIDFRMSTLPPKRHQNDLPKPHFWTPLGTKWAQNTEK